MPLPLIASQIGAMTLPFVGQLLQGAQNRRLAEFQMDANRQLLQEQLEYNSPKNQMKRFEEAGLNKNLIYGQGNPGNQTAPLTHPDIRPNDFSQLTQVVPMLNQSALAQAQVSALNQKTVKDGVLTQLADAQRQVVERNPILKDSYLNDMIDLMKSTALIKANEFEMSSHMTSFLTDMQNPENRSIAQRKVLAEVARLEQQFDLGSKDLEIKKEILNSQQFKNAILEVQKKFLADGDIGPQQILTFVMLLLGKM